MYSWLCFAFIWSFRIVSSVANYQNNVLSLTSMEVIQDIDSEHSLPFIETFFLIKKQWAPSSLPPPRNLSFQYMSYYWYTFVWWYMLLSIINFCFMYIHNVRVFCFQVYIYIMICGLMIRFHTDAIGINGESDYLNLIVGFLNWWYIAS